MLTIRAQQLAALDSAAGSAFVAAVAASLRADHPALVDGLGTDALLARVLRGLAIAESYGIEGEVPLALFIRLLFVVGPGFDLHSSVRAVLLAAEGIPGERLARLVRDLPPEGWGAAAGGDPSAWDAARPGEAVQ